MNGIAFGRYRLQEMIGEGGMGQVWRAYDTVTDRIVAVKLLPEHCATDPSFRERFRREAHETAQLREPHVVPIHGYGEIDGHLYLDMRLIDGADAKTVLNRDGAMKPQMAVAVITQAAAALDAAHAQSLVHRDVKPSNLLVTDSGFVYLIDFGIARAADDTALTSAGAMIGTLAYMAPERFTTGVADARSDVYALACVLCECLTGIPPYLGNSAEQQIAAHLTADPPALSLRRPDLPGGFDDVVARGMAKDPDDRYPTAGELAAAAGHALTTGAAAITGSTTRTTPRSESVRIRRDGPAPPRRKRPVIRVAVAVVAVLIAAAMVAGLWRLTHRSTPEVAFDGKYEVTYTPRTLKGKLDGHQKYHRVWSVRSHCPPHSERCVASITSQNPDEPEKPPAPLVADYRDGTWMMTRELPPEPDTDCESPITKAPQNVPTWQRVQFRFGAPSWTGSYFGFAGGPCAYIQELGMTLSRVGEIDPNVAVVPPETIPARVDTPPIALISGIYDVTITYTATPDVLNPPPPDKIRQRYDTICVRLGDRCAATTQADPRAIFSPLLVLEGGAWRSDYNIPYPCNVGSNEPHTNATFHWELFQSDAGPNPTEFLTGTWVRDKADPCPATSRATVEMQRVSSVGHQPGAFGPAVSQGRG